MSVTAGVNGANNDPPYAATPGFYIADVGPAADGQGEAYQVDAYGYGGAAGTVAVVESTYEVQQGVVCRSCSQ
jgi:type IV pilus assembly protein PilX